MIGDLVSSKRDWVALLLALGLLDVPHFVEFTGLDIIVFLVAFSTLLLAPRLLLAQRPLMPHSLR